MNKCIVFLLLLVSCVQHETTSPCVDTRLPENIDVLCTNPDLHNVNGTWIYNNKKYNGFIIENSSGKIVSKLPIVDGKENGIGIGWYLNGKKKHERSFLHGNREGYHKNWYDNDTLAYVYFFKNDMYEGVQKTFYRSGHRWQVLNYINGYEEGKQKSWSGDGRVINNFTVKNGKLYGIIGRYDCMSVIKN